MFLRLLRASGALTARYWPSGFGLALSLAAALIGSLSGSAIAIGQSRLVRCPSEAFRSPCEGVLTFSNGSRYIGEFNEGMPNGQGKLIFTNGAQYEGEVQDGVPSGRGAYLYGNGMHYAGQFLNGLPNGKGTLTLPDGSQFTGEFKDGKLVQKRVEGDAAAIPH
jgi:hypothetical protein